jgi:hypothetical protein
MIKYHKYIKEMLLDSTFIIQLYLKSYTDTVYK